MSDYAHHYAKAARRSSLSDNLAALFRAARENPYDETLHGAIADAIDEEHPGSPFPQLIRSLYPTLVGRTPDGGGNLWYPEFEKSWEGTSPYKAHLGSHGPFELYLGHESPPYEPHDLALGRNNHASPNARWVLHAVAQPNRGDHVGYTFEFPHERAHEVPQIAPAAAEHISPHRGRVTTQVAMFPGSRTVVPVDMSEGVWRDREARRFEDTMDAQERGR